MPIRKTKKQTSLLQKEIKIKLTGSSKEEIQEVAHAIHSMNHPLLIGGAAKRKVHMTHTSTRPIKIFDGLS